ncbi:WD40-repeat-containing domain [Pseudocohnilembus persalinus]|uniref:WD40-repeat-containing domain n=1 Tax=Pseudocohnilembus persalinus TaxID=266149 RepID=A0A0V0QXM8_PSEPJ|nr:WD40-repeat-containing domain [Pseudocohnilembus persalinus]|eukprot:KRX07003.1 WD40-repeat-containing domain [Pseudocohnilembus persalinus]
MDDIKLPTRAYLRKEAHEDIKGHFHFIGNQISDNELKSAIPFFYCEENGHEQNQLDCVCVEENCSYKGLTCFRCVNYKHNNHRDSIIPLHNFVGDLVKNQTDKQKVLQEELQKCNRFKDFVINQVREYVDDMIEHFQNFVSRVLKYHSIFSNQFEDAMIKSDVIIHKILYKQHIRRDYFNRYIKEAVENINNQDKLKKEQYKAPSDYSYASIRNLQQKKDREYILRDYEKAYEYSNSFQSELMQVSKELKFILNDNAKHIKEKIDLHKLSYNIPQFDDSLNQIQNQFKKQFQGKLENIFGSNPVQMPKIENLGHVKGLDSIDSLLRNNSMSSQSMLRLPRYLEQQSSETLQCLINQQRKKVTIGRLFSSVASASIMKLNQISTNQREISCVCAMSDDIICVAGRFNPQIEFYKTSDKSFLMSIDTNTKQGIKCLLSLKRDKENPGEWQPIIVAGTYYDDASLLSYRIDVLRTMDNKIQLSYKDYKQFEKKYNEAVTCLECLYTNEFFVAGYSSGTVAVFSTQNSIPLSVLSNIYEGPVNTLLTIEPGKMYLSTSQDKIRYHYIQHMNHEKVEQKLTAFFVSTYPISCIQHTTGLNEDGSYLKFKHFLTSDLASRYQSKSEQSGILRILRMVENQNALSEEGHLQIYNEDLDNNTIQDMILIEPRKKNRTIYLITFGSKHRIKLWEIKSAFTQTLKLWEKNIHDFLQPPGANAIKAKLLYETLEFTNLKFSDVGPKVQLLSAYESTYNGKILIKFCTVDHASKSDVQIFDLEFLVTYS